MNRNILIVEPHPFHYEVLPGVVSVFEELNFSITLLVHDNFEKDDTFSRLKTSMLINILYFSKDIKEVLLESFISEYDFIFFNSYDYFHDGIKENILSYLGYIPNTKYGFLGIVHNKSILRLNDVQYIKEKRLFALTPFCYEGYNIPLFSANAYGVTAVHDKLQSPIRVTMIGESNKRYLLERAIEVTNITNIEFSYIGKANIIKEFITNSIRNILFLVKSDNPKARKFHYRGWKSIKYLGQMKFEDMYGELEKSDFILTLLDINNSYSREFLDGKTSGSKQLSLGFNVPLIINDDFGRSFGFSENNSVFYDGNNVATALYRISNMKNTEYTNIKTDLSLFSDMCSMKTKNNVNIAIGCITSAEDNRRR